MHMPDQYSIAYSLWRLESLLMIGPSAPAASSPPHVLAPARGLLAISTWPMERRVIGPLSPRVHYLTAAIQIAGSIERLPEAGPAVRRLLWRFAVNIPARLDSAGDVEPRQVARAGQAELDVHETADLDVRRPAAQRACRQLDDAGQLVGNRLGAARRRGTALLRGPVITSLSAGPATRTRSPGMRTEQWKVRAL